MIVGKYLINFADNYFWDENGMSHVTTFFIWEYQWLKLLYKEDGQFLVKVSLIEI